jgi:hypothetical protein
MAKEWGRDVQGLMVLSSVLLGELAEQFGNREELLAVYERQAQSTSDNLTAIEGI